jgi:hypothetical protein
MPSELAVRPIAWVGAAIGGTVILVACGVLLLLHLWNTPPDTQRARMPYTVEIQGPTLQPAPQLDLAQYRAEKQRILDTAAWIDASGGIARIPIADAMAMLAASAAHGSSAAAMVATSPAAAASAAASTHAAAVSAVSAGWAALPDAPAPGGPAAPVSLDTSRAPAKSAASAASPTAAASAVVPPGSAR